MRIAPYEDRHFPAVVALLRSHWAPTHALYEKALFDWQHRVTSPAGGSLVVEAAELIAFLGVIPSTYLVDGEARAGAALTMWCVDEQHRGAGLGPLLVREVERRFPVTLTLGCGAQALGLYQRMQYAVLPRLHRYCAPCALPGFETLLREPKTQRELAAWFAPLEAHLGKAPLPQHQPDAQELAATWSRATQGIFRFTQRRDAEFWSWRYIDNVGFRYHRLSLGPGGDAAVVRIERVVAPGQARLEALRVLRIIELLPAEPDCWRQPAAPEFAAFLHALLKWGQRHGCVAADFQSSSRQLEPALLQAGFRTAVGTEPELARLFQPYRPDADPVNFVWKIVAGDRRPLPVAAEDTWFVKSDGDMDRTNFWPVIGE